MWFALDDIHPDSGPFEYVPSSHEWPVITRERVLSFMEPDAVHTPDWPSRSQDWVAEACEAEIESRGAQVEKFAARKGDILIWDNDLIHQGSAPVNRLIERRALIAHYSAASVRQDMPNRARHTTGGLYATFDHPLV